MGGRTYCTSVSALALPNASITFNTNSPPKLSPLFTHPPTHP